MSRPTFCGTCGARSSLYAQQCWKCYSDGRGNQERRFWERTRKTDGCWLWTGQARGGYGRLSVNNRPKAAHRLSWELHNGPIPTGLHVLHSCDNPSCVRPDHLFLGTNADNIHDRNAKGRRPSTAGENSNTAKLTWAEVREMRALRAQGWMQKDLAVRFGVTASQVSVIVNQKAWREAA